MYDAVYELAYEELRGAMLTDDKTVRDERVAALTADIQQKLAETFPEGSALIAEAIYKIEKKIVREYILKEGKRVDGRRLDEIRPMSAAVSLLPRAHGSGLFQRGQTQVMTIVTLGSISESQMLDGVDLEEEKRYMHHYNFPGYSVEKRKLQEVPAGEKSAMARLQKGRSSLSYRAKKNSLTLSGWFRKC